MEGVGGGGCGGGGGFSVNFLSISTALYSRSRHLVRRKISRSIAEKVASNSSCRHNIEDVDIMLDSRIVRIDYLKVKRCMYVLTC